MNNSIMEWNCKDYPGSIVAEVESKLQERMKNSKITCAQALQLAREMKVEPRLVGATANRLGFKLVECQLGCFGSKER